METKTCTEFNIGKHINNFVKIYIQNVKTVIAQDV